MKYLHLVFILNDSFQELNFLISSIWFNAGWVLIIGMPDVSENKKEKVWSDNMQSRPLKVCIGVIHYLDFRMLLFFSSCLSRIWSAWQPFVFFLPAAFITLWYYKHVSGNDLSVWHTIYPNSTHIFVAVELFFSVLVSLWYLNARDQRKRLIKLHIKLRHLYASYHFLLT